MTKPPDDTPQTDSAEDEVPELPLTDDDILDAMRHIPGYLDITTEDFRTIYHLSHHHAIDRMFGYVKAESLMREGFEPLTPDMHLDDAAKAIIRSGYKSLPVVDADGRVIGILTETDFLRRLKVDTFLQLLLNILDGSSEFKNCCHQTPVSDAMTAPVVTITRDASFRQIIGALHHHDGRSMPVVDSGGHLQGLLLRKDVIRVYNLENPQ